MTLNYKSEQHLEQAARRIYENAVSPDYKLLIKQLYFDVLHDDESSATLEFKAQQAFTLLQKRRLSNENLVEYIYAEDGERIIIQLLTKDKPFIVDSILAEFARLEIPVLMVVHTMISVIRDTGGEFIELAATGNPEYMVQLTISSNIEEDVVSQLLNKLEVILAHVTYAVTDWRAMVRLIEGVAADLAIGDNVLEQQELLGWLCNDNFVFLGAVRCKIVNDEVENIAGTEMGVLRGNWYDKSTIRHYGAAISQQEQVLITKWDKRSIVHRNAHMDMVIIRQNMVGGKDPEIVVVLGLFTASVYRQSVQRIPMIRQKIEQVLEDYGYAPTSYNYKELLTAIESFPRAELLQMNAEELRYTASEIVALMLSPRVKVFMRQDITRQFVNCIVMMPEKHFSTEVRIVVEKIILNALDATLSKRYVQIGETSLACLKMTIKLKREIEIEDQVVKAIEQQITKTVTSWDDELLKALQKIYAKPAALQHHMKYVSSFERAYKVVFSADQAAEDVRNCEMALEGRQTVFDITKFQDANAGNIVVLKVYSVDTEVLVSDAVPILENLGLSVKSVKNYHLAWPQNNSVYISSFILVPTNQSANIEMDTQLCQMLHEALRMVYQDMLDDDSFNSLILYCRLNYRQVNLMRAYAHFLRQTKYAQSMEYTVSVLLAYPALTMQIVQLFEAQFDPSCADDAQTSLQVVEISKAIRRDLLGIRSSNEDKVIRSLLGVMLATLRCNFYQRDAAGNFKNYIAFKLDSSVIADLPMPKPYAEIFVYSTRFEGVHLRGGPIARGGLRWSDRPEDFRTEVLGLMKAQMTKNSVIVPVGSKGGFVLKRADISDRDAYLQEGVRCYQQFLCGLLDLTDNIVEHEIVPPSEVVRLDGDDPYLVVAADKGTATFSDHANAVSQEYGFWLGDAFASGGSVGYDHKKMGITAKGTWISILSHLEALGIDLANTAITCVGIGDMSGDVFGNGMLFSPNLKLVAAFNHLHIFLDPDPDVAVSYAERKRLFDMPRSQWTDYNPKLISQGGGVFERKSKSITLSNEVRKLLGVVEDEMSPDEVIKAILKAEVDLLFNGGIGTYVKAASEANEHIGDKANDAVRLNGSELRAKIVGEGGNLGFTQLGRIEYAAKGGLINTDFIDNSAGVDCSDHEVNIKIAFSAAVSAGVLTMQQRNSILESLVDEVADLVLADNLKQNLILTLEQCGKSGHIVQNHAWLIRHLEHRKELSREIEFLPDDEILNTMIGAKKGLTRPELSVLMAYAKNSAFKMCSNVNWCEEDYFSKYLLQYFPATLLELEVMLPYIQKHTLKNQIVATMLVNQFINMLGVSFLHQVLDSHDVKRVFKSFIIVLDVLEVMPMWKRLANNADAALGHEDKYTALLWIQNQLKASIRWFLQFHERIDKIDVITEQYRAALGNITGHWEQIIPPVVGERVFATTPNSMYELQRRCYALDLAYINIKHGFDFASIAERYYECDRMMGVSWLVENSRLFISRHYIQNMAVESLIAELQMLHLQIVVQKLQSIGEQPSTNIDLFLASKACKTLNGYLADIAATNILDSFISKLVVAIHMVRDIAAGR
jgi:glutamate dehydrogenase